jgi:hypothetical protein
VDRGSLLRCAGWRLQFLANGPSACCECVLAVPRSGFVGLGPGVPTTIHGPRERGQHDCDESDEGVRGRGLKAPRGSRMPTFVLPRGCGQCPLLRLLYWMAEAALSSVRFGSVGFLTTVRRNFGLCTCGLARRLWIAHWFIHAQHDMARAATRLAFYEEALKSRTTSNSETGS